MILPAGRRLADIDSYDFGEVQTPQFLFMDQTASGLFKRAVQQEVAEVSLKPGF